MNHMERRGLMPFDQDIFNGGPGGPSDNHTESYEIGRKLSEAIIEAIVQSYNANEPPCENCFENAIIFNLVSYLTFSKANPHHGRSLESIQRQIKQIIEMAIDDGTAQAERARKKEGL